MTGDDAPAGDRTLRQALWRFAGKLDEVPRPFTVAWSVAITLGLATIDVATGPEISFSIFYLAPVGLAAWLTTRPIAYGIAVLSAATWLVADHLAGATYSHPSIPYWNASVRLGFFAIVAELLLSLRRHLRNEQILARTDPLTGVANPRAFLEAVDAELYRARRYARPLSLAYIDLDDFKRVNDQLGHSAGDELLRFIAQHVVRNVRASDVVGRLGGDEFAILLPETDSVGAKAAAGKVRRHLNNAMADSPTSVTLSIGAVTFQSPPASADDAVNIADRLMYEVKGGGKDDVAHQSVHA
ncbi:MAG TPA: GGDEF domain-containing protein [Actinomycetota bacterium]|nr:GGDEF domain-containing protein [Actinomycetota bacterium]